MSILRHVVRVAAMLSFVLSFAMYAVFVQLSEAYVGWTGYPTILFLACTATAALSMLVFVELTREIHKKKGSE